MKSSASDVKPFAWAGVTMTIPAAWETGQLGGGYALLEHAFRPVLEIKTAVIKGRFSFRRHLNQLARIGGQKTAPALELGDPPSQWPEFPPDARVKTFQWQGRHISAEGLLYHCRHCQRATLIQFYDQGREAIHLVLPTFRDHANQDGPTVAVYDIQAALPHTFGLTRFRFDTGYFEICFRHAKETMRLWRWSPADIILERTDGDLELFAGTNGLFPPGATCRSFAGGLEWQWQNNASRRWRDRLFPTSRSPRHALRIWHRRSANRLLAVGAENLENADTFDRICRSYGIISEKNTVTAPDEG